MTLRVALLGPPAIEIGGLPLEVDTRKAIALLAYLACEAGPIPRETLGALLWPDYSRDRSRAALRRTLSALRKGLGDGWLETDRQQVALAKGNGLSIDVRDFSRLSARSSLGALAEAADLYRGEFMAGFTLRDASEFDDWQLRQAAMYRRTASDVFESLSVGLAAQGNFRSAIEAANRWLSLDMLHEPAHRQLLLLHAWAGDRPSAVRQYRECVRILEDELGVPPLEETTETYRAIVEDRLDPPPAKAPRRHTAGSQPRPSSGPGPGGFVGRSSELDFLETAYGRAARELTVVAIRGEPGIGKTRLASEFLDGLEDGAPIILVRSHRGETDLPYGLAVDALRAGAGLKGSSQRMEKVADRWLMEASRIAPELSEFRPGLPEPPPVDSPGSQRRLLDGIATVLGAMTQGDRTGLLILDDAQSADTESLDALAVLIAHITAPLCVLIIYRSDEVPADHALSVLVRDAVRSGKGSTLELSRLSTDEIAELVLIDIPDHEDMTTDLARLSEGVPYFLVEYIAAVRDEEALSPLPRGVHELLTDRVAQLSGVATQVLGAASVIGRSFDFDTLQTASGRSTEETLTGLEEVIRRGLVRSLEEEGSFDFDHERLQEFVYSSINPVRRRLLHSRVADSLVSGTGRDQALIAAAAAQHFQAAGREDEAAVQHVAAADYASALYANRQALDHYQAALALGHPEVGRIREAIGILEALAGDYGASLANLEAAAAVVEGDDLGRIEHEIGTVHARAGDWEMAEARYAAAEDVISEASERSRLLADWATVAYGKGDRTEARELASQALDEAILADDHMALADAHNVIGIVERENDPERARRHHEMSLSLVTDLDPVIRAAALNNLALAYLAEGHPELGLEAGYEALSICERVGDRHKLAATHSNLADLLHALSREDEALGHLTESARLFSEIGMEPGSLEPEIWMLREW